MTGLIGIEEVSKLLNVTKVTLRKWDDKGKLIAVKTPTGHRKYRISDIENIVNG